MKSLTQDLVLAGPFSFIASAGCTSSIAAGQFGFVWRSFCFGYLQELAGSFGTAK